MQILIMKLIMFIQYCIRSTSSGILYITVDYDNDNLIVRDEYDFTGSQDLLVTLSNANLVDENADATKDTVEITVTNTTGITLESSQDQNGKNVNDLNYEQRLLNVTFRDSEAREDPLQDVINYYNKIHGICPKQILYTRTWSCLGS